MAFGSWIKKVAKKISDGFKKVVPIVSSDDCSGWGPDRNSNITSHLA